MRSPLCELLEDRVLLSAQAYDWNNVTIKGTGFSDGIVFSPAQQGLVYMNTDMGGAYRWDTSVNKWIPLTDWITNNDPQWGIKYNGAETVAPDPTDASRVYVGLGTYLGGNGAILRSSDQGRTWLRTNVPFGMDGNGSGRNSGQRMMVDPNSHNILFYGTRQNGIWKSTDYGATWNQLTGYSFTTDASGAGQNVGTDWLLIDKSSGTPGNPSQVIYAGAATTGNGKIWRSSDGGATWSAISGQPTGNTLYTVRGALTPDGSTLYITYGVGDVGIGPSGQSNGYLYKVVNPKNASPTWTALTIDSPHGQGGWSGITIDPNNPNDLFVTTMDRWWPGDDIYRSINGGTTWTALNAQANRDNSSSAWASSVGLHWLGDIQIDPFNANDVMFTTGFGVFRSSNAMAATPTWAFFCDGFEQSAVSELVSPNTGTVNLFSAIGDRDGFRHADFNVSPARLGQSQGLATGANSDIDVAWNDASYIVRVTYTSPYVQYSNDNGVTWAWMSSTGVTATTGGDNLAISADGTKVVWEQGGTARVIYATRSGSGASATWSSWSTPATNQPADGSKVVADLASPTTFYAYVGTTLSRSTDGGANWTVMTSSAPGSGQSIRAVPGNAGHLLLTTGGGGLWRSTNGGATWTRINSSAVTEAYELGVGMAAPGQSYPAMSIMGVVNGISGFFRSDDQGATWTMISDLAHEYGDVVVIQGDPRVYGRLYVGTNGRGILYADIHTAQTSLPSGWSTLDIGSPGSTGAAGSPASGNWEVIGGGAGIGGTSDQFRLAYTTATGDTQITARVMDVPNRSPANNNAKAGIMFRTSTAANSAYVLLAMTPGSVNGAVFQYRSTAGGATTTTNATGVWNPQWIRLTRVGDTFTAERSADGITWTLVGSATVALGATVSAGLAVTASDNNQLNISSFQNVSIGAPQAPPTAPSNLDGTALTDHRIDLTWTDNSNNESSFTLERATDSGFTQNFTSVSLSANTTSYQDQSGLASSTTYFYRVRASNSGGFSAYSNVISRTTLANHSIFTASQDIGYSTPAGSYDEDTGTYTVLGAGSDIWNNADQFRFVYRTLAGDGTITARVASVQNTDPWAKAGVMFRNTLDAGSIHAFMAITPGNGAAFQYRDSTNGTSSNANVTGYSAPYWVRLVRSGNTFTGYCSSDGSTWTQVGSPTILGMNTTVYVGLAVTSHNAATLCTSTFTNVQITAPAPSTVALQVNDGSAQRSMVSSLMLTFDKPVTLAGDAVTLALRGGTFSGGLLLTPSTDQRTYTVTFSGVGPSLADGTYVLTLKASSVTDDLNQALTGGDRRFRFYRLFGDANGDRMVNTTDLALFRAALGTNTGYFDYDNSGSVTLSDYSQFRRRLMKRLI